MWDRIQLEGHKDAGEGTKATAASTFRMEIF